MLNNFSYHKLIQLPHEIAFWLLLMSSSFEATSSRQLVLCISYGAEGVGVGQGWSSLFKETR